jgi:hypothetical protein
MPLSSSGNVIILLQTANYFILFWKYLPPFSIHFLPKNISCPPIFSITTKMTVSSFWLMSSDWIFSCHNLILIGRRSHYQQTLKLVVGRKRCSGRQTCHYYKFLVCSLPLKHFLCETKPKLGFALLGLFCDAMPDRRQPIYGTSNCWMWICWKFYLLICIFTDLPKMLLLMANVKNCK